ncbi:hypothetical protein [Thalassobacillus sp. CUG 92003]|uniref:hypothetical protein n=1 Tax=Thalassobacillus sp. CUG 92003 TaxID=2736641 RepID=UPI0015E642C6|nr:hypothetical protein [Thalassobacillus sp. CUG 92003]
MKTRFEKWIDENNVKGDAKDLFNESVLCYKISAYRASFIMGYLGLQTILRERLLNAQNKPDNIPQKMWTDRLNDLKDEKIWDSTVFDFVNRQSPDNPFLINDDIRTQYSYWKTIRNDCAHAKNNIISYPHVESFWLFIESNLSKFVVNGGKSGLLEKIKKHYDSKYTPPNTDVSPLVREIPHAMTNGDISLFLKEVDDYFEEETISFEVFDGDSITYQFWNYIAYSPSQVLREGFLEFIKSDWDIFRKYIVVFEDKLNEISSDDSFIREFWKDEIWKLFIWQDTDGWKMVKRLVDNQIIPTNEVDDFIKTLFKKTKTKSIPEDFIIEFLKDTEYFNLLRKFLFGERKMSTPPNGIDFANRRWKLIRFYLFHMPLDALIVSELNSAFLASSYGTFNRQMTELFKQDEDFSRQYKEILEEKQLTVPSILEESEIMEEDTD